MKTRFIHLACASIGVTAALACGASGTGDGDSEPGENAGDAASTILDGSAGEASAPRDAALEARAPEQCSADGWCATPLPDVGLTVDDISPRDDRAFATAYSTARGMKFLEWQDATQAWTYIDDGTQNAVRAQTVNVWAPNDDEVYVAMIHYGVLYGEADGFGAFVYHGLRPVAPATKWTWTRDRIPCDVPGFVLPYIGGSSADDVYLSYCETIYRRQPETGEAGSASWLPEWVDDDPDSLLALQGMTGAGVGDAWFVGSRGDDPSTCTVVLRKSATGYERIADSTLLPDGTCAEKPGALRLEGRFLGFQALPNDRLLGIRYGATVGNDVVRIADDGAGTYEVATANPSPKFDVNLRNVWATSEDDIWLVTTNGIDLAGAGRILRGANVWSGAGTYGYSTLIRDGVPNIQSLFQLRGTSNSNLWAVGQERAFHKSTP